ncbi:phage head-tail adapter protein [Streptococcus iniae]|uniref:phage head-tail adapter protein n=1 Tax=Streptococcus iniae TaxID=1346 RepID=UPI00217EFD5D|nr:phage head-tail adapter protein [Streptococcus iniae]
MKQKTNNGDLKTPVVFYSTTTDDSLDGRDIKLNELFRTLAEVYNPSSKDITIASDRGVKAQYTIKMRSPYSAYYPSNDHKVDILDKRVQSKKLGIVDIRPDFVDDDFIIIVAGD